MEKDSAFKLLKELFDSIPKEIPKRKPLITTAYISRRGIEQLKKNFPGSVMEIERDFYYFRGQYIRPAQEL